ncbi:recombinase family protein [Nocardia sp. NBC_01499]|uniref:recombinase family protein n=1 Tax=Nocardia sp. NBC_01499 TaxID=2903597 RepID=UPI00386D1171
MNVPALAVESDNPDVKLTAKERRALVARLRKAIVGIDRAGSGLRIGIYARISRDRKGFARGVERQIEDDIALAKLVGGPVVAIYVDNDMSAYSGKPRPDYERMLTDIEAGLVDFVIAWHPDRLHRSPAELERFIEIVERRRVEVQTVKAGHWDLATPSGRMVARQLGAVARYESEHKAERTIREREQRAMAGQWAGGPRSYGYEPDGVTIRPAEQLIVRATIESLSAGISVRAIVSDFNASGVPTTRNGKRWTSSALRSVLMNPRIAGLATYKGEVIGKGVWPALVSEDQWRAVCAILSSPDRKTNTWGAAVRWLGSGLYGCGGCEEDRLIVSSSKAGRKVYRCRSIRDIRKRDGAVHVARDVSDLDSYVELSVVERLSRPDMVELFAPKANMADVNGLRVELTGAKARLDELSSLFADDRISAGQLATGSERLRVRVDSIERELAEMAQVGPLAEFATIADVERHWFGTSPDRSDGLSLMKRRAVIDELVSVTVLPGRRGSGFDPLLVDLAWKVTA